MGLGMAQCARKRRPGTSVTGSAPPCSNPSTGRTSAWWLSRGWTSPRLLVPSGSWAPASSGTTTPNSTGATTASASPRPAERRGPRGVRGASWEAGAAPGRSKWECKWERRFLKAQPPPLCTEATAQPRALPLQNPRAASREPQQLGRWEPGEHPPPSILRPGVPGESRVWGCTSRDFQGDVQ